MTYCSLTTRECQTILINQDFQSKVYEEYLIYDAIGMIGQVGGTLGTLYFLLCIVLLEPQKINSFLSF